MLTLQSRIHSQKDRTQKLIYTLTRPSGDTTIEVSAIDKQDGKVILCLPTQTNCAQACKFCHTTGLAGKVAVTNLTRYEIETITREAFVDAGFTDTEGDLLVSFMGVGEPMANTTELVHAMLRLRGWGVLIRLNVRFGLATMLPRQHVEDFRSFTTLLAGLKLPVKIHLSLHYTSDVKRLEWMPMASPITQSIYLLEWYRRLTGNPVEIHYTLIDGVNDCVRDGSTLKTLLSESKIPVKLLKYNPAPGDSHRSPDADWTKYFQSMLEDKGIPTEWYDSPGADIASACGMFATDLYIPAKKPETREVPEGTPLYQAGTDQLVGIALNNPKRDGVVNIGASL
jgi:adenine C2-methylase RlmN of 23S rRNA A2503 and tRNA A37